MAKYAVSAFLFFLFSHFHKKPLSAKSLHFEQNDRKIDILMTSKRMAYFWYSCPNILQYLIVTCFHFSNFEPLETALLVIVPFEGRCDLLSF